MKFFNTKIYTIEQYPNQIPIKDCTFEEAIQQTGFGLYNISLILFCGLGILGVIAESIGLSLIIPVAQCDLKLTNEMKGILASATVLGILLSSQFWGYLGDTHGRRIMIIPMFLSCVSTFLSTFSPDYYTLLVLRLVSGVLLGSGAGTIYAFVSEFHSNKYRTSALIWTSSFVSGASIYVPGLAWLILPNEWSIFIGILNIYYKPWRLMIFLFTLPTLISSLALFWFPESPKYLLSKNNDSNGTLKILQNIYARNTNLNASTFGVKSIISTTVAPPTTDDKKTNFLKTIWNQTVPVFLPPYLWKTLLICSLQFICFFSSLGFFNWVPHILNKLFENERNVKNICEILNLEKKENFEQLSTLIDYENSTIINFQNTPICNDTVIVETIEITFILGVVMFLVYIFTAIVVRWVSNKNILLIILIVTGSSGLFVHTVNNTMFILVLLCLFTFSGITVGVINTFTPNVYPTKYRAMAISISFIFGRIGGVGGSNLAAFLLDVNCNATFYIYSGLLLVGAGLTLLLPSI